MILADRTLTLLQPVDPFDVRLVNPASIDLQVAETFTVQPGEFRLAHTIETVTIRDDHIGFVCGKSSWARVGLLVEAAGLVDPGFCGQIVLELYVLGPEPVRLEAGMRICQLTIETLDQPAERPYGHHGHYQHQTGNQPAWFGKNIGAMKL